MASRTPLSTSFLMLAFMLLAVIHTGVTARNLHATNGCPCGYLVKQLGMCKLCGAPPSTSIPDDPPSTPQSPSGVTSTGTPTTCGEGSSGCTPAGSPTEWEVVITADCSEDVIIAVKDPSGEPAKFKRLQVGGRTGDKYNWNYADYTGPLPVTIYAYTLESEKSWNGDDCFEATLPWAQDEVLQKAEPTQRTVCGMKFNSLQNIDTYSWEGVIHYTGEIKLSCA